jgi:hypothetical protein
VIVGGVRAKLAAGQLSVRVTEVTVPEATTPQQPVTVTARGFVTVLQQVQVSTTSEATTTVALPKADLKLTGTMKGRVTSRADRKPIANVVLQFRPDVEGSTILVEGATDNNGEYLIGGIPTGKVQVAIAADGYLPTSVKTVVVQDFKSSGNTALNFVLVPTSTKVTVRGLTVDLSTQTPVAGASVKIGSRPAVTSGADGRFQVAEVPVGSQTVTVKMNGYNDYSRTVDVAPGMAELRLELAPNSAQPPPGPATISGTVTVRNRADNGGVTVKAIEVGTNQVLGQTVTNSSGAYGLFVPPGRYRIEVSFRGVTISQVVVLGGAGRVLTGIDFRITAP